MWRKPGSWPQRCGPSGGQARRTCSLSAAAQRASDTWLLRDAAVDRAAAHRRNRVPHRAASGSSQIAREAPLLGDLKAAIWILELRVRSESSRPGSASSSPLAGAELSSQVSSRRPSASASRARCGGVAKVGQVDTTLLLVLEAQLGKPELSQRPLRCSPARSARPPAPTQPPTSLLSPPRSAPASGGEVTSRTSSFTRTA